MRIEHVSCEAPFDRSAHCCSDTPQVKSPLSDVDEERDYLLRVKSYGIFACGVCSVPGRSFAKRISGPYWIIFGRAHFVRNLVESLEVDYCLVKKSHAPVSSKLFQDSIYPWLFEGVPLCRRHHKELNDVLVTSFFCQ